MDRGGTPPRSRRARDAPSSGELSTLPEQKEVTRAPALPHRAHLATVFCPAPRSWWRRWAGRWGRRRSEASAGSSGIAATVQWTNCHDKCSRPHPRPPRAQSRHDPGITTRPTPGGRSARRTRSPRSRPSTTRPTHPGGPGRTIVRARFPLSPAPCATSIASKTLGHSSAIQDRK